MTLFNNWSLKWKMAGGITIILLAAAAAVLAHFPRSQREALKEGLEAKVRVVADMLATSLGHAVDLHQKMVMQTADGQQIYMGAGDRDELSGAEEIFAGVKQDKDLLAVKIEGVNNKRLAGFNDEKITDDSQPPKGNRSHLQFREDGLWVAKEIATFGKRVGVLRMLYSVESYNAKVIANMRAGLLFSVAMILLGFAVALFIGYSLVRPLDTMTKTFKRMADGDLSQEPLKITSHDEIGNLASAYNDLLRLLRDLSEHAREIAAGDLRRQVSSKGDLAEAFVAMTATFTEIASKFNELSSSIDQRTSNILATAREQEAGAAQQAATVSQVNATMGELAATARQIASNAENVTIAAEQAASTVMEGREALSSFVDAIGNIQMGNKTINDNIVQLNRHVQQIGGIIEIINDIADRSDLLALNAALEGTKAGEAGKGFLLVAEEMRRLAENVFNSTAEIKQLIGEVTEATNATVMATEMGMKTTQQGVLRAEETERVFDRIRQTIEDTSQAARQISVATQQQHTGTDQVVPSMAELSEVAQQSLEGIRQTTQSVGELSAIATDLRQLVARYRLPLEEDHHVGDESQD